MKKLTLKKLYNTSFPEIYHKFLKGEELSSNELEALLSIALYLVNREDKILQKFGYRLFLMYSEKTKDYKPLYELSINKGLIPISEFISQNLDYNEKYGNFYTIMNSANNENFKRKDYYQTIKQFMLYKKAKEENDKSQIIVAPTSYGKTELILSFIEENIDKKICILTPTKSLLAQTKKRIIDDLGYQKIITSPEMSFDKNGSILAVLTQERLLKLLQNEPSLKFDLLIVDEAHNLLDEFSNHNARSVILASVIIICKKRNENLIQKFLTPFLKSKESVSLKYINNDSEWLTINENLKSEIFYFYDTQANEKFILDQHSPKSNKLLEIQSTNFNANDLSPETKIIINNQNSKNIIYLNKPKDLEDFAQNLYNELDSIVNEELDKAINDIKEYVHEDYNLAIFLKKGIIYHHGSVLEQVRYFIEDLYKNEPYLKFLISNSTLLEGVNIPATKMFILDPRKGRSLLSPSAFKNLIGRVCRFSEIFNPKTGNLGYLLPEIHIIKGKYTYKSFDIENFIKRVKILTKDEDSIEDEIKNPLLKSSEAKDEDKKKAEEILENLSRKDEISTEHGDSPRTEVGRLCFENRINSIDILENEMKIDEELKKIEKIGDINMLFKTLGSVFFTKIIENGFDNIKRMINIEAQIFYKMLISWRINSLSLKEMVDKIVSYWNSLDEESKKFVYVGNRWGDKKRDGHLELWIDITYKNNSQKANLAIVRLKEEFDFIDNEILKYIEVLRTLELVDESLYLKIKFGTDNEEKIAMLRYGISSSLVKVLKEKYADFVRVDFEKNIVIFNENLVSKMEENRENGILITEVKINSKEQQDL